MPLPIIIAAVGLGLSIYQTVKADQDKAKAEREMDDYERQNLTNAYAAMSPYPTEALAMRREAAEVELATMANLAGKAGRGLSIAGRSGDQYDKRIRSISADQEKYQYERDKLIAQGEMEVQGMTENRENMDLAGWANLYGAADQNKNNALISAGNSLAYGLENYSTTPTTTDTTNTNTGSQLDIGSNSGISFDTQYNDKPYN